MTIIGDKAILAVEYEVADLSHPEQAVWLLGKVCIWAGGIRIGNYDDGAALSVALATFPELLKHSGARADSTLMNASTDDLFARIHRALYIDTGQSDEQVANDSEYYERFAALPVGFDVFDGWMAFLVEDSTVGRYVWRAPNGGVHEVNIPAGEFDHVVSTFLADLKNRSEKPPVPNLDEPV